MLQTKSILMDVRLESSDLQEVLLRLSKKDWKPVLLESQRTILELAGVQDRVVLPIRDPRAYGPRVPPGLLTGDVFFRDSDVYYLLTHHEEMDFTYHGRYMIRQGHGAPPGLELGIITSDANTAEQKLQGFASNLQQIIMSSIDGRKTRHMQFEWKELEEGTPRLDSIAKTEAEQSDVKFERPQIEPQELAAAGALSSEPTRRTLVELSQAGFARARDILSRKGKQHEELQTAIDNLKKHGLVNVEYLLECKQSGMPLTRLAAKDQLENPATGGLRCPRCNTQFKDESLSEGYSVSELGRRLSQRSNWMTIWVTDKLCEVGVPLNAILWNLSETGEEVDILVESLGELWIFELKDREFGSGDAHPLNYRQVRYKATKAIIVTTEKVSKDARRVFEDLAKERSKRGRIPTYVEGLDAVHDALEKEISAASLRYANQKLSTLTELSGYDFRRIIAAKFGESAPPEDQVDEDMLFYYR
jgi:hypothetical protein